MKNPDKMHLRGVEFVKESLINQGSLWLLRKIIGRPQFISAVLKNVPKKEEFCKFEISKLFHISTSTDMKHFLLLMVKNQNRSTNFEPALGSLLAIYKEKEFGEPSNFHFTMRYYYEIVAIFEILVERYSLKDVAKTEAKKAPKPV